MVEPHPRLYIAVYSKKHAAQARRRSNGTNRAKKIVRQLKARDEQRRKGVE